MRAVGGETSFARTGTGLRATGLLALLSAAAMLLLAINAGEASAARVQCPGTFRVLHNDHVGRMSLPAGRYQITILSSGRPSCTAASKLFTRFLEDFDGKLPRRLPDQRREASVRARARGSDLP